MRKLVFLLLLFVPFLINANPSFLLAQYIPQAFIKNLSIVNITYNGSEYTLFYSNLTPYFLLNNTGFVTNYTKIFYIIKPFILSKAISYANFSSLNNNMLKFINSSQAAINDCLRETGLDNGYTCTLSNHCQSCQSVPVCSIALYKTDGPTGPLGRGIMQFESQYSNLTTNLTNFYSAIALVNYSNIAIELNRINHAFANIYNITFSMPANPLFSPGPNITNQQIATCNYYTNISSAPWYCVALGFCGNTQGMLTFNYTILNNTKKELNYINSLPLTDSQIGSLAMHVVYEYDTYVEPKIIKQKTNELNTILNTTLFGYGKIVNESTLLLTSLNNKTLANALNKLEENYSILTTNYLFINLTQMNKTIYKLFENVTKLYNELSTTYNNTLRLANNNTVKMLYFELNGNNNSKLAYLGFEQQALLRNISNGSINLIFSRLSNISSSLNTLHTTNNQLLDFVKYFNRGFIIFMANKTGFSYKDNIALVPFYSSLFSFFMWLILIGIVYAIYLILKLHHRIIHNKKVYRNWHILFAILFIIAIVYAIIVYAIAYNANHTTYLNEVINAINNSQYVAVGITNTSYAQFSCAKDLLNRLNNIDKKAILIKINTYTCSVGNETLDINSCLNFYAQHQIPLIELVDSNNNSISLYNFYGTSIVYYANYSTMNSCYISDLI